MLLGDAHVDILLPNKSRGHQLREIWDVGIPFHREGRQQDFYCESHSQEVLLLGHYKFVRKAQTADYNH